MKNFQIAVGALCLLLQTINAAGANESKVATANTKANNSGTSAFMQVEPSSIPENGKEDQPPKTYQMMKMSGEEHESFGFVRISKDGSATFALTPVRGSLGDFSLETATELLGKPIPASSEYGAQDPFYIFNLKCFGWQREPEIFHIDAKTNETGKISQIRVRGFGVLKPEWQAAK